MSANAVNAKLMTIAVKIKACGTGSAYISVNVGSASLIIGGFPRVNPPVININTLTPFPMRIKPNNNLTILRLSMRKILAEYNTPTNNNNNIYLYQTLTLIVNKILTVTPITTTYMNKSKHKVVPSYHNKL